MRAIKKVLLHLKSGKKFYVKELEDFHTQYGIIAKTDLKKKEATSSKGEKFLVLEPEFADLWQQLQRGPQIMLQKDIGLILAKTGAHKEFNVVDAGGGSGGLCLSLAHVCGKVIVYEINAEHFDIVAKNAALFGIKNIELKQQNIYEGIDEQDLDLITLDLPEPWRVTEHAMEALRQGGHLVVYLPNLNQVKLFIDSTRGSKITVIETMELLERKWKIEEKIMRPEFEMLGHTGFLVFCRRL